MKAHRMGKEYLGIYIPKTVERELGIKRGDYLEWRIEGNEFIISKTEVVNSEMTQEFKVWKEWKAKEGKLLPNSDSMS